MKATYIATLLVLLAIVLSSCNTSSSAQTKVSGATTPASSQIVDTGNLAGWSQSSSNQDVKDFILSQTQGRVHTSTQISYDLQRGGWVSIWKSIDPQVLSNTAGISFYLKGRGASNTIEFKLRLLYPGDTDETYFYTSKQISTNTNGKWKLLQVPYSSFTCRHPANQCIDSQSRKPRPLDLTKVVKIDFAVANKSGDMTGSGMVAFDEVVGMSTIAVRDMILSEYALPLGVILLIVIFFVILLYFIGRDSSSPQKQPDWTPHRIISPAEEEAMLRHEPYGGSIPGYTEAPKRTECKDEVDHDWEVLYDSANGANFIRCRTCGDERHSD